MSNMNKHTFHTTDMHCSNCVMRIESLEDTLPGVASIKASYHHQTVVVEFDETRISLEQIISAIKDLGYTLHLTD